jgi:hypothetical protein
MSLNMLRRVQRYETLPEDGLLATDQDADQVDWSVGAHTALLRWRNRGGFPMQWATWCDGAKPVVSTAPRMLAEQVRQKTSDILAET